MGKLTEDMRMALFDIDRSPGFSGAHWAYGGYSLQTLAGLRRRGLIQDDRYTGTISLSTWSLTDAGRAALNKDQ